MSSSSDAVASFRTVLVTGLLIGVAAPPSAAQTPETFGYGAHEVRTTAMPLITVLLDFENAQFPADTPPSYFENLLFGTELGRTDSAGRLLGSIAGRGGFFDENSLGAFRFTNAGIVGPIRVADDPSTALREDTVECGGQDGPSLVVTVVVCNGDRWSMAHGLREVARRIDLRSFDNGDRLLTPPEVMFLFVLAKRDQGGRNRTPVDKCVLLYSDRYFACGPGPLQAWPIIEVDTGVATIAHELTHALGIGWEGYGRWLATGSPDNGRYSLMAGTIENPRDRWTVHLDPFAKMQLGWVVPRIIPVSPSTSACITLDAIEFKSPVTARNSVALLYDPSRGTDEFFLLEYRRTIPGNYDNDQFRTGFVGLGSRGGLGLWAVRINSAKDPLGVPSQDGLSNCGKGTERCLDFGLHLYPPSPRGFGRVGLPLAGAGFWLPDDTATALSWVQSDQGLVPVTVHSAGVSATTTVLGVEVGNGVCTDLDLPGTIWAAPPGVLAFTQRFSTDPIKGVPIMTDVWTTDRLVLERSARMAISSVPEEPAPIEWAVTPRSGEPLDVRVRIQDARPLGFTPLDRDTPPELVFNVRLDDGQTRHAQYLLLADTGIRGTVTTSSVVTVESAIDGTPIGTPLTLESSLTLNDPTVPTLGDRPAGAPLEIESANVSVKSDFLQVKAVFTLGAASDGIDPPSEPTNFSIGTLAFALPAGAWRVQTAPKTPLTFTFEGIASGVVLDVKLIQLGPARYEFRATGRGKPVRDIRSPELVTLGFGDETQTTTASVDRRK
jgi:M6 family metalloprotease-like protein